MDNYEEHLDKVEEDAYERKYAKKLVEACISGVVDALATSHRMTPLQVIQTKAPLITQIVQSVKSLADSDLLSKKRGIDISYSLDDLSYRIQGEVPPREAKELAWIETTFANPESTDRQVDEAAAVEQAIEDVKKIGSETESPELTELYESGRLAVTAEVTK